MAVPMAERLTIARLCLRPAPHRRPLTRRHFAHRRPRPYPATPIFRFKVPACAPERNLANFYYLRPIFQPGPGRMHSVTSEKPSGRRGLTRHVGGCDAVQRDRWKAVEGSENCSIYIVLGELTRSLGDLESVATCSRVNAPCPLGIGRAERIPIEMLVSIHLRWRDSSQLIAAYRRRGVTRSRY